MWNAGSFIFQKSSRTASDHTTSERNFAAAEAAFQKRKLPVVACVSRHVEFRREFSRAILHRFFAQGTSPEHGMGNGTFDSKPDGQRAVSPYLGKARRSLQQQIHPRGVRTTFHDQHYSLAVHDD